MGEVAPQNIIVTRCGDEYRVAGMAPLDDESQIIELDYIPRPPHAPAYKYERYSDDMRQSMQIANREALWQLNPVIDTPHVLVALIRERTGLAGVVLRQRGIAVQLARRAARRVIPRQWTFNFFVKLPLSRRVEFVVERAIEHAISEKHDSIGTGGILLSMLRHDVLTGEFLRSLSFDPVELEQTLVVYLHRFMVEAPGQPLQLANWAPSE